MYRESEGRHALVSRATVRRDRHQFTTTAQRCCQPTRQLTRSAFVRQITVNVTHYVCNYLLHTFFFSVYFYPCHVMLARVLAGNESAPIQLAQCRVPGLAISSAKISIYFFKYMEAILLNSTRKLLWFKIIKTLIVV